MYGLLFHWQDMSNQENNLRICIEFVITQGKRHGHGFAGLVFFGDFPGSVLLRIHTMYHNTYFSGFFDE